MDFTRENIKFGLDQPIPPHWGNVTDCNFQLPHLTQLPHYSQNNNNINNNTTLPNLNSTPFLNNNLIVEIYHKPRTVEGGWQKIVSGSQVRVTRDRGKKLKITVHAPSGIDLLEKDCQLDVFNEVNTSISSQIQIQSKQKTGFGEIEFIFKIFALCKKIQFQVTSKFNNITLTGISVTFSSHNNGHRSALDTKKRKVENSQQLIDNQSFNNNNNDNDNDNDDDNQNNIIFSNNSTKIIDSHLFVVGSVKAKEFVQHSDLRLKTNVKDIINSIQIISKLQGKSYYWKEGTVEQDSEKKIFGLIAQEVQKVIPEVVFEDPKTGLLSISYLQILPILLQAFNDFIEISNSETAENREKLKELQESANKLAKKLDNGNLGNGKDIDSFANESKSILFKKMEQEKLQVQKEVENERKSLGKWIKLLIYSQLVFAILGVIFILLGIFLILLSSLSKESAEVKNEDISTREIEFDLGATFLALGLFFIVITTPGLIITCWYCNSTLWNFF